MKAPHPATLLALALADIAMRKGEVHGSYPIAMTATRVVGMAASYRKLVEHGCNCNLTDRQVNRMESLQRRADALLAPYGLEMSHPWGLCMYAMPIGSDGTSQSQAHLLA